MSYTTFTVTVNNPGSGNKYYIDGELHPSLVLNPGFIYKFNQSDGTNGTHQIAFSTTQDGTHATPTPGTQYTTGYSYNGTAGTDGIATLEVTTDTPTTLYYYCVNHSGMAGTSDVTIETISVNSLSDTDLSSTLGANNDASTSETPSSELLIYSPSHKGGNDKWKNETISQTFFVG